MNLTLIDWGIVAVVFPSGIVVEEFDAEGYALASSPVKVYSGAADTAVGLAVTAVGLAVTTIGELLEAATESALFTSFLARKAEGVKPTFYALFAPKSVKSRFDPFCPSLTPSADCATKGDCRFALREREMKRTERHHLQEDQMAHGLSWLIDYAKKWKREVTIIAGALVFAAVVFGALVLVRSHSRSVQSGIIGQVGDVAAEAAQKPEKLAELEKLAGERRTARLANLELAKYWAERSDWAKAESTLGRIAGAPKDLLYYQTEDIKARVALGRKDFDKAIAIYQKISDEKPKVYPLDAVLFRLAESRELKGETKEALAIYKKLQEEYSQSYYGYEASLKAGRLGLRK